MKQIIRITENDLSNVINNVVSRMISERMLGQDEHFTPYSDEEAENNRKGHTWGTPEMRNPSYAKALRDAEARKRQKQA